MSDWQPIETAPTGGKTRVLTERGEAQWETDRYAKVPRPYWRIASFGCPRATEDRARQPKWWMPFPPSPAA